MKKLFLLILLLVSLLFNISCGDEENKDVITYVVTFVNEDVLEEVTVNRGDKVSKPVDPVKDGFEFIGWYLNDELFNFESQIVSNITLNAKYEEVIKTYNVLVVFDNNKIKFNDITELSIDDITKKDGYEYLGLYTDSLYQNEFDGSLNNDMILYLKYKKYHSVLVKTDKEEINLKVYHGEKIDTNIFYEKGYKNCLYYSDRNNVYMGASSLFNIDDEKVYTDIELTLVEGLAVSFYEEGLLKERVTIESESQLKEEGYRYKYSNYEFYLDEEYKNKFDFKTKITENTNIYLKPIKVDDSKVKVQINIKDIYDEVTIVYALYIDKGDFLSSNTLFALCDRFNIYGSLNAFLYYDEACSLVYNYGKVYEDIVLYSYIMPTKASDGTAYLQIYDNDEYAWYDVSKGTVIDEKYALITSGKQFDGFYYDSAFTKPYNNEPIYVDTKLFTKTKDFASDDVIHNVKFYQIANFDKNGIDALVKELSTGYYKPRINTYVKDGQSIYEYQYRVRTDGFLVPFALYNVTRMELYNGEPITEDTEFIFLSNGGQNSISLDVRTYIFSRDFYPNQKLILLLYNDQENKNLMFLPNNNQKIVTIIDKEYNTYQMFVSVNSVISKDEILNIMKAKNINTENIEVSDIFVTGDFVIKIN